MVRFISNIITFLPEFENVNINSKPMHHYTRVESGNTQEKLLVTCRHWEEEHQQDGGITQPWIQHPKV